MQKKRHAFSIEPGGSNDDFIVTVELWRSTVELCREIFPQDRASKAVWEMALIAHGCSSDGTYRDLEKRRIARYRKARLNVLKAHQILCDFHGLEELTLQSKKSLLSEIAASLATHIAKLSPKGRKPAVNKRYALHALAALFHRHGVSVTTTDDPPSDFIRLAHAFLSNIGISGGFESVADAAHKAELLRQREPGKGWNHTSGGAGFVLGHLGIMPSVRNYNARLTYSELDDGTCRVQAHYTPALSGN